MPEPLYTLVTSTVTLIVGVILVCQVTPTYEPTPFLGRFALSIVGALLVIGVVLRGVWAIS